jgi:hypothetical protein
MMMTDQEDHKDDIDGKYDLYARPHRSMTTIEEATIFKLHEYDDDIDIPLMKRDMNRSLVQSLSMECVYNESGI